MRDPVIVALRNRVSAQADSAVGEEAARITIVLKDGRRLDKFVEHAIGSLQNPMPDSALEAKFLDLATAALPAARARKLLDLCWNIEKLPAASELAKAAAA